MRHAAGAARVARCGRAVAHGFAARNGGRRPLDLSDEAFVHTEATLGGEKHPPGRVASACGAGYCTKNTR